MDLTGFLNWAMLRLAFSSPSGCLLAFQSHSNGICSMPLGSRWSFGMPILVGSSLRLVFSSPSGCWRLEVGGWNHLHKAGIARVNQRKRYADARGLVYGGGKPPPYKDESCARQRNSTWGAKNVSDRQSEDPRKYYRLELVPLVCFEQVTANSIVTLLPIRKAVTGDP